MWLEASIWLWGPLAGVFAAWTIWRNLTADRELRRLRERVAELEAADNSSRRRAA
jgi:hypothetical protein